jgi:transposase
MARPDLSRLSSEEKDALILALLDRVAALEAKLGQPPKTPDNSSLPPSRGQKASRPPRPKKPRRPRDGPGVTRALCADPERIVDCYAQACAHCGTAVTAPAGQILRHAYDHIDLPPLRPVVTRVRPRSSAGAAPTAGGGCAGRHPRRCRRARRSAHRS